MVPRAAASRSTGRPFPHSDLISQTHAWEIGDINGERIHGDTPYQRGDARRRQHRGAMGQGSGIAIAIAEGHGGDAAFPGASQLAP